MSSLNNNYTSLYGQYTTLQSNYDDMTKIANLQKNQKVASGTVLHIPSNSFDSIEIQTPYAGYIRVQLQATHPVTLMLTNYKYPFTVDYPVFGTPISSGNFALPILDGTNYFEMYSPSDIDATVTVTITLFY